MLSQELCQLLDKYIFTISMSSTFKNRIPKRKYRERVQPANREKLGFLQKKKDYKLRAKNYHEKEDMLNKFKLKAATKNEDEFYFKMVKGKKNEDGQHVYEDSDEEFDEKQFRLALKNQNYSLVQMQRSIVQNKITKLQANLQLISEQKPRKHKIFVENQAELEKFQPHLAYNTALQLAQNNLLEVNPEYMSKNKLPEQISQINLKEKYNKLGQYKKKEQMLTRLLMKIGYEKNLLGKERKKIKKIRKQKVHKYFLERKK